MKKIDGGQTSPPRARYGGGGVIARQPFFCAVRIEILIPLKSKH